MTMPRTALVLTLLFVLAGSLVGQARPASAATRLQTLVQPFVRRFCSQCHGPKEPEASLNLTRLFATAPGIDAIGMLRDVRRVLARGEMPPDDEPEPEDEERANLVGWIDATIAGLKSKIDPGRVTVRRLSRTEYRFAIRDLFGVTADVTRGFPQEDLGYGFDNIGGSLSISPLQLESYAEAARRVARTAIVSADHLRPETTSYELSEVHLSGRTALRNDAVVFISRGRLRAPVDPPRPGRYSLRVRAFGHQAGDEVAKMAVWLGAEQKQVIEVDATRERPKTYEIPLDLDGDRADFALEFTNDFYNAKARDRKRRDRNLVVEAVELVGPLDPARVSPSHREIFAGDPGEGPVAQRARPLLTRLIARCWRRPARPAEVQRLTKIVADAVATGDSFAEAMRLGLQAILVSPHFLFRVEPETPAAADPQPSAGEETAGRESAGSTSEALDSFAMASRLSFFLWSSVPDARLRKRAAAGELTDVAVLVAEATRMLADPKASALATNFASQWLELRSLEDLSPDPKRFPEFRPSLRAAMREETERFFAAVLAERSPATRLLDARFTFLNEELARHYGIAGVSGGEFRRVRLRDRNRGGLVTHASIQTLTSNPDRTSPVKRGKWILENLLDDPPPPPKPGTDAFAGDADVRIAANMRAQLAAHRKSQACAVCHNRMDALGLAMENYDAIGRWRTEDHGQPIDASGALPGGRTIDGPLALRRELRRGDAFLRCLTKKLFLFGVGREVRGADEITLDGLVEQLGRRATLQEIILGIVKLDAFRRRTLEKK